MSVSGSGAWGARPSHLMDPLRNVGLDAGRIATSPASPPTSSRNNGRGASATAGVRGITRRSRWRSPYLRSLEIRGARRRGSLAPWPRSSRPYCRGGGVAVRRRFICGREVSMRRPKTFMRGREASMRRPKTFIPRPEAFAHGREVSMRWPKTVIPWPEGFASRPKTFTPQPEGFTPRPEVFTPRPERIKTFPPTEGSPAPRRADPRKTTVGSSGSKDNLRCSAQKA